MTRPPSPDGTTAEEPARPWRRLLDGNVLWLSVASFFNDVSSEMVFPLLPLFLVGTLGAGPAFLGLVEGMAETTAAFVKLAGGWLSDRTGRRRPWIGGGYSIAALTRPLLAAAASPWHVLALRFTDRVGKGIRTAPRDALLAGSAAPGLRGRAFGLHLLMGSLLRNTLFSKNNIDRAFTALTVCPAFRKPVIDFVQDLPPYHRLAARLIASAPATYVQWRRFLKEGGRINPSALGSFASLAGHLDLQWKHRPGRQ